MSLNWDISKCSPAAKSDEHWPTTDTFIWTTMAVGLGELTAKNEKEWKVRLAMWAMTESSPRNGFETLLALPAAEWAMRHGLSTNVTATTRAAFKRRLAEFVEREAVARLRASAWCSACKGSDDNHAENCPVLASRVDG